MNRCNKFEKTFESRAENEGLSVPGWMDFPGIYLVEAELWFFLFALAFAYSYASALGGQLFVVEYICIFEMSWHSISDPFVPEGIDWGDPI